MLHANNIASLLSLTENNLMKYWHTLSKDQKMWHIFRERNANGSQKDFFPSADRGSVCSLKLCYFFDLFSQPLLH